jgi:5-methylcytosine-specific restriction enzyme subunit McrC
LINDLREIEEMTGQGTRTAQLVTLFEYESVNALGAYELKCLEQLSKTTGLELLKPVVENG